MKPRQDPDTADNENKARKDLTAPITLLCVRSQPDGSSAQVQVIPPPTPPFSRLGGVQGLLSFSALLNALHLGLNLFTVSQRAPLS